MFSPVKQNGALYSCGKYNIFIAIYITGLVQGFLLILGDKHLTALTDARPLSQNVQVQWTITKPHGIISHQKSTQR